MSKKFFNVFHKPQEDFIADAYVSPESEDDSDKELKTAFNQGEIQPGLFKEEIEKEQCPYNTDALNRKIVSLQDDVDWLEYVDVTSNLKYDVPVEEIERKGTAEVHDDFKRDMAFYRQAQEGIKEALRKLTDVEVPTRRPNDYYAEMAKSDEHMKKVRQRLMQRKEAADRSEKAKKLREMRKFGKEVQRANELRRQEEKRKMTEAVKQHQKGAKDSLNALLDESGPPAKRPKQTAQTSAPKRPNKKREAKNKKYGFGGQKKRSKYNTAESAGDVTKDFRRNSARAAKERPVASGNAKRRQRPGKAARQRFQQRRQNRR